MSSGNGTEPSPISLAPGMKGPETIRRKLLRSHLLVAGLGVGLLVVSLFSTLWLRTTTVHLAEARGASEYISMQALSGLHRSEASLRAWVVSGNPTFRQERTAAWSLEIQPAIERLQVLSSRWSEAERARMQELVAVLNNLQEAQWWVEEVAGTPGNEPSKDLYRRDISPLATSVISAITEVIELERNRFSESARSPLLGNAADFRWTFTYATGRFRDFVASGDAVARNDSLQSFDRASRSLDVLGEEQALLRPQQSEVLGFIRQEIPGLKRLVEQAIDLRERDDWHVARHRLTTEVDPLASHADALLTRISQKEQELMLQEAKQATNVSSAVIGISVLLIAGSLVLAIVLSLRSATRIAAPVTVLTSALEEIAAGRSTGSLRVTGNDELGRLTRAFNTMAAALQGSEARLESVYTTTQDGIILIDTAGRIQSITKVAAEMFGYSAPELLGRNVSVLMPSPYREQHNDYLSNFVRTGDAKIIDIGRDLPGRRRSGEQFPIHLAVSEVRLGEETFFTGVVSDISRRQQAETERLNLGRILEESLNEIYVFDADTLNFLYVNRAARDNLQYTMRELSNLTPVDIKPEFTHESFGSRVAALRSGERPAIEFETFHVRKDGTTYPVEVHLQTSRFEQRDAFAAVILDITERNKAEANLRLLSKVFSDSVEAIFIKDPAGRIIDANPAAERQYGWSRDELVGSSIKMLVPPDEHEMRDELMERCLRGEQVRGVECTRITKSGDRLPLSLTLSVMTNDADEPVGFVTISEDITRRKQNEAELRIKDNAIRSAITGVAFADLGGTITFANPAFVRMFGYTHESEVVGRSNREFGSDESVIMEIMNALKTDGFWSGEDIAVKKDGSQFPIELAVALMKDPHGAPVGMVATFIDLSARKQAEEALRESEQRLRSIVDTAADAILTINTRGIIQSCNPAGERIFSYAVDELVGRNVKMLMPSPYHEEHDSYLARYLQTGERRIIGIGREVVAKRKDGSTFPAQLSVGEVTHLGIFTGIIRDLTSEKRSQDRLLQSERLAAIGEAMTGLVHESRNAMASVQAQLRMLSRRINDRPELGQYIEGALKSQLEVQKLFEEVRQWAAPKKLQILRTDLGKLLRAAWDKLEPERLTRTAELREQQHSIDLTCEADEFSMIQVCLNILQNALAACEDPVVITADYAETNLGGRPALCVTIRDNGPGLSPEQCERMFEAFYTTKTHGTGLGLPIARRTMQAHGGEIEPGSGSGGAEFKLTIPRTQL